MSKAQALSRNAFKRWFPIQTRWSDNDVYGHVNNVAYYSWFDTAINQLLIEAGVLNMAQPRVLGLVVHTACDYFASVAYPQCIDLGVRVARIGNSSVQYELGVFVKSQDSSAALGQFVHVYVDAHTRKPCALPENLRQFLHTLQGPGSEN